jgi:hypothetical protein
MADYVPSGSDNVAADELTTLNGAGSSGVKVQRVKPGYGVDGDFRDVSPAFALPVNLSSSAGGIGFTTQALTASAAATLAGSASTSGSYVLDVSKAGNASFAIAATTSFVGTVVFEMSFDPAGANGSWAPVPCIPEDGTAAPMSSIVLNAGALYVRQFTTGMFGAQLFRVRCSAFTSGSLTVIGVGGPGWYEGQPALAPSNSMIGAVSLASGTVAAVTTVNTGGAATNTTLLAADSTRKGLFIWNRGTVPLMIGFTTATSATVFSMMIPPNQGYEVPGWLAPFAVTGQTSVATQPVNFTTVS